MPLLLQGPDISGMPMLAELSSQKKMEGMESSLHAVTLGFPKPKHTTNSLEGGCWGSQVRVSALRFALGASGLICMLMLSLIEDFMCASWTLLTCLR